METLNNKNHLSATIGALLLVLSQSVTAFDSGSTGADGVLNPTIDTVLNVPEPDGIFNFTSVNIPLGVTVTFAPNTTNTPVTFLSSGDVQIDGTLSVNGGDSFDVGTAGDSNLADDGQPGLGGPGGFNGGTGGDFGASERGSDGQGPGAGGGGRFRTGTTGCGGAGGSFSTSADDGSVVGFGCVGNNGLRGPNYGTNELSPLIGGSGGGGAASGTVYRGSGGGGGSGAILIAATGIITVNGLLSARGGNSGDSAGTSVEGIGGTGGAGSGGAIRLIATEITGVGTLNVEEGVPGDSISQNGREGGKGGRGRIRLESPLATFAGSIIPSNSSSIFSLSSVPGNVFVAGMPSLSITTVDGQTAPVLPTGNLDPANTDITLPVSTVNPVTINFATTNVPVNGTTAVDLTVVPEFATAITVTSTVLAGDTNSATASASVSIPPGLSVLQAELSFTVTVAMGEEFSRFAEGEQVAKVKLNVNPEGQSETTFVTISGEEFTFLSNAIAMR